MISPFFRKQKKTGNITSGRYVCFARGIKQTHTRSQTTNRENESRNGSHPCIKIPAASMLSCSLLLPTEDKYSKYPIYQELKDELIARNASVEQAEIMRAEFTEREESLHQEHQKEMEILKQEYDANLEELRYLRFI